MRDGVVVRPAALDELDSAARLRGMMAAEDGLAWDRDHAGWQARFAEYFRAKQQRGDAQVFFAAAGDEIVGMAAFSVLDEYRAPVLGMLRGWVNSVYVKPEWRRGGIARVLLHEGMAWLRERGCVKVRLRTSDAGEALYESLGFVRGREMERDL